MGMWHTTNMAYTTIHKVLQWDMEMKIYGM